MKNKNNKKNEIEELSKNSIKASINSLEENNHWISRFNDLEHLVGNEDSHWSLSNNVFKLNHDVIETKNEFKLVMEISGLSDDDIEIFISGNTVEVRGTRSSTYNEKNASFHKKEISYGEFNKTICIPANCNANKAEAFVTNGMLTIVFPKEKQQKKKIKITKQNKSKK